MPEKTGHNARATSAVKSAVAFVDNWLDYWFSHETVPGLSVAIRYNGDLVMNKAWGFADQEKKEKLTTDHVFRVASHSKMLAATAIGLLQERGLLTLDDPVEKHLPWMKKAREVRGVSIRQLLNHRAGLFRDGEDSSFWNLERDFPSVDELREKTITMKPLAYKPVGIKYSNWGYGLIGQIIEQVSGVPYSRFIDENIIGPLGLSSTATDAQHVRGKRFAVSYSDIVNGAHKPFLTEVTTNALEAATGLCSTASDLSLFVYEQAQKKGKILSAGTRRALMHDFRKVAGQDGVTYGLGMERERTGNHILTGHCGGFPGQKTATFCDTRNGLTVSVCMNRESAPAWDLASGIMKSLHFHIDNKISPAGTKKAACNGMYGNLSGAFNAIVLRDKLVLLEPEQADLWQDPRKLPKIGPNRYKVNDSGGFGRDGEVASFTRREGNVVLNYGSEPFVKI